MRAWRSRTLLTLAVALSACASSATHVLEQRAASRRGHLLVAASIQSAVNNVSTKDPIYTTSPSTATLLQWATSHQHTTPVDHSYCVECFLVVGVKSSVVSGFYERQTIRETWADVLTTQASGVRVVFLGCQPSISCDVSPRDQEAILDAIAEEKRHFGDLLTHELGGCTDSYYTLVDKSLSFFKWTAVHYPQAGFVMVTDDDTYVRIDNLVAMLKAPSTPRWRLYGGQVWSTQFDTVVRPIRTPTAKNYVGYDHFPMPSFPPFATGPQYVLSSDLVRFLAHNSDHLRGVGTLEDVTVAYWLLALLQLPPRHLSQFDNIRFALCHNALVSYTNLSPSGLRAAHANIINGKSFCSGFSFASWMKPSEEASLLRLRLTGPGRKEQPIEIQWDGRYDWSTRIAHIIVTLVVSKSKELATAIYVPSHIAFIGFCRELFEAAKVMMPTTALDSSFVFELRDGMRSFLRTSLAREPR